MEHNKQVQNYKHIENVHALNNDAEHWMQLHDMLRKNKSYTNWPNLSSFRSTPRTHFQRNKTHSLTHDTFNYNDNNGGDNTALLEKPLYQSLKEQSYKISTSAPNHNKTLHKNKSKWPLPQEILRIAAASSQFQQQQAHVTPANVGAKFTTAAHEFELEETLNSSKSSAEKGAADIIPLTQDFENNSIDVEQHVTKKTIGSKTAAPATVLNDASAAQETSLEQNVAEQIPASESNAPSTASSIHIGVDDTTSPTAASNNRLSSADVVIYSVYKAVSPPTSSLALTTNKLVAETAQSNLSLETPPTANKSRENTENPDALDLQNLSSNNDSVDNPITALFGFEYKGVRESNLGRRSAAQHNATTTTTSRIIRVPEIKSNIGCTNCQSACYDDHNELSLSSPEIIEKSDKQDVDSDGVDAEDDDTNDEVLFNKNTTVSLSGKHVVEQQQAVLDIEKDEQTDEQHFVDEAEADTTATSDAKCFAINSEIITKGFNKKLAETVEFCPETGALNLTYVIPISQYYRLPNIELQLSSSRLLNWTICNESGQTPATNLKHATLTRTNNNTSLLVISIPSRGAFNYDIRLRSSNNLTNHEEICRANEHKNTLLQYNYSILRNCD